MDKKTIIFGVIGIVLVIWLIKKLQPGETQTVTQLIPVGSVPNNANADSRQLFDTNKTGAFMGVLELGKAQLAAQIQAQNIQSQIPLETIRADVAKNQTAAQREIGLASFDRDIQLGGLSSKTAIQLAQLQTDAQLAATRATVEAANQQLEAQLAARQAEMQQAANAISSAGITYRNQSLERQGTILNALTTLYTGQAPYTYQNAFGKVNKPLIEQLFPQGIGGTLQSLFSFI